MQALEHANSGYVLHLKVFRPFQMSFFMRSDVNKLSLNDHKYQIIHMSHMMTQ